MNNHSGVSRMDKDQAFIVLHTPFKMSFYSKMQSLKFANNLPHLDPKTSFEKPNGVTVLFGKSNSAEKKMPGPSSNEF